jgi:hypothetical protein
MPNVTLNGLDLSKSESLLVSYHRPSRQWFASVGDLEKAYQRKMATGETTAEALGLLFLALGATLTDTN